MYHSALGPAVSSKRVDRFEDAGNVAFVHDVMTGFLPKEYENCDVFYSDLAWLPGFKKFNRRAQKEDGRKYKEYLSAVSQIINNRSAPMIMVTGKHALKSLPEASYVAPVFLNAGEALALVYETEDQKPFKVSDGPVDAEELLRYLASDVGFERIGDFHCGYGRSGRVFQEEGRSWVLSDFNPMCIGNIAERIMEWRKN